MHGKIFRWTREGGVRLFHSVQRIPPSPNTPPTAPRTTNLYDLERAEVSADGTTLAITGRLDCSRRCGFVDGWSTWVDSPEEVRDPPREASVVGRARLSPNGRYLAVFPLTSVRHPYIVDLVTGQTVTEDFHTFLNPSEGAIVSDAGEVLLHGHGTISDDGRRMPSLMIWDAEGVRTLGEFPGEMIEEAILSADGNLVILTSRWPPPHSSQRRVRLLDRRDGGLRTVAEGAGDRWAPWLSGDGERLLYLSSGSGTVQAEIAELSTGARTALPAVAEGLLSAILSEDGRVVFATTELGRLLRWEAGNADWEELIGRTLSLNGPRFAAPGSLIRVEGAGLVGLSASGTGPSSGGLTLELDGMPLFVVGATRSEAFALIPWAFPPAEDEPRSLTANSSGLLARFEGPPWTVEVRERLPTVWPAAESDGGRFFALATDGEFTRRISRDEPARLGEVIHVYASGLGPVVGGPVDAAAPADPLPWLVEPLTCGWTIQTEAGSISGPVETFYSGLAPGLWGVYQMSFRLPENLAAEGRFPGLLPIGCGVDAPDEFGFFLPLLR